MKIKVIDLLNKIAKREQPSHIRMYGRDWYWNNFDGYVTENSLSTTPDAQIYLFSSYRLDFALNKEVEVLEEVEDKEYEDIEEIAMHVVDENGFAENDELFRNTINDLIRNQKKLIERINNASK